MNEIAQGLIIHFVNQYLTPTVIQTNRKSVINDLPAPLKIGDSVNMSVVVCISKTSTRRIDLYLDKFTNVEQHSYVVYLGFNLRMEQ